MLHFHSNNPENIKEEVCKEYTKIKLLTTNWIFHEWTLHKVYRVLHNNYYPKVFIAKVMEQATSEIIDINKPTTPGKRLSETERKTAILNMSSEIKRQQMIYQQTNAWVRTKT